MNNGGLKVSWSKAIWQNIASLKIRILVWFVVQNKLLLTVDNLSIRNIRVGEFVFHVGLIVNQLYFFLFIIKVFGLFVGSVKFVVMLKGDLDTSDHGGLYGERK